MKTDAHDPLESVVLAARERRLVSHALRQLLTEHRRRKQVRLDVRLGQYQPPHPPRRTGRWGEEVRVETHHVFVFLDQRPMKVRVEHNLRALHKRREAHRREGLGKVGGKFCALVVRVLEEQRV